MLWNAVLKTSPERMRAIQFKKMKRIVSIAYEKSAFYREYYEKKGFYPGMLESYEDIAKIPIVRREMLKETASERILTVSNTQRLHMHTTSGSSGIPVHYYYSTKEDLVKNYGVLRSYINMGMRLTDTTVALRDPIDIRKPGLLERIGLLAYDYYNIYDPIEQTYQSLNEKYQVIDVLKGMPSDLLNLCQTIRMHGGIFPRVKLLISDSEVLDSLARVYIQTTIGTEILDWYGSVENGCIAYQLKGSDKYILNEDQILVENGSLEGFMGDAIITNLNNSVFPTIRYQIGDVIDFGDGKSELPGISRKTIDQIQGKYLDFILLADGTVISPHVPKQELTHMPGIKRFQIMQRASDDILIKIEKDNNYTEETEERIISTMRDVFQGKAHCSIEYDDTLSIKSGYRKFKVIESKIAQEFLSAQSTKDSEEKR